MTFGELTRDELIELKEHLILEREPELSWWDIANADEIVTDDEIEQAFGECVFCTDDFFCNK